MLCRLPKAGAVAHGTCALALHTCAVALHICAVALGTWHAEASTLAQTKCTHEAVSLPAGSVTTPW